MTEEVDWASESGWGCTRESMSIPWTDSEGKTELALAGAHAAGVPRKID